MIGAALAVAGACAWVFSCFIAYRAGAQTRRVRYEFTLKGMEPC